MSQFNKQEQKAHNSSEPTDVAAITTYAQLQLRIALLQKEKEFQEDKLKNTFSEMLSLLNIVSLFKAATNKEQPLDIAKSGVNIVLNLIIDLVFGKHRSIKGYLSSIMIERFTTMLVNNNLTNIISGISSLFNKKSQYDKSQEF